MVFILICFHMTKDWAKLSKRQNNVSIEKLEIRTPINPEKKLLHR